MAENTANKPAPSEKAKKKKKVDAMAADKAQMKSKAKSSFELVRLRNFFYVDNYRKLVAVLVFMSVLLVALSFCTYHLLTNKPSPRYFATNIQGGIIPLHQLSTPGMKTSFVLGWSARGVSKAFTFNYVQYREQLEDVKDTYFTAQGGQQFVKELESSNDLKAVVAGKFIVTAQPAAAPSLIWQGIVPRGEYKGRYGWQVDQPIVLTVQNANQINRRNLDIKLTVVRDSYLIDNKAVNMDGTKGIGIAQILVRGDGIVNPGQPALQQAQASV